eukprot:31886-Eustigmatos_ZCMA.PRE.1
MSAHGTTERAVELQRLFLKLVEEIPGHGGSSERSGQPPSDGGRGCAGALQAEGPRHPSSHDHLCFLTGPDHGGLCQVHRK